MSSRRLLRAAEAIREVVGTAIITELRDPRVEGATVTFVEVAPDMRLARVHVSVMGDEKKQQLCIYGLQNSAGFLQHKIGKRIDTRYTPKLKFVLDQGLKNAMRVTQILEEVLPSSDRESGDSPTSDPQTDGDKSNDLPVDTGSSTNTDNQPMHEIAHDELLGNNNEEAT